MSPPNKSDPTSPSPDSFTKLHNAHNAKVADLETCVMIFNPAQRRTWRGSELTAG